MNFIPSPHDLRRLAVEAAIHPVTAERAYRGRAIRSTVRARLVQAALSLGMRLPPDAGGQATLPNQGR